MFYDKNVAFEAHFTLMRRPRIKCISLCADVYAVYAKKAAEAAKARASMKVC